MTLRGERKVLASTGSLPDINSVGKALTGKNLEGTGEKCLIFRLLKASPLSVNLVTQALGKQGGSGMAEFLGFGRAWLQSPGGLVLPKD